MGARGAVLLMAYGSPSSLDDVARYYAHIRATRGTAPPSEKEVEELKEKYRRIGGSSPLLEITLRQARALRQELGGRGIEVEVYVGMRHSSPFIEEAVREAHRRGVERLLGLAMTPHYSRLSVGDYEEALARAVRGVGRGLRYSMVKSFHLHPLFLEAWREKIERALQGLSDEQRRTLPVLFTAHSLPEAILSWHDPYPQQVRESAEALAAMLGLTRWEVAYQSAGRSGGRWLGPDVLTRIRELARAGAERMLVAPIGFVADHLEVLYDIDIEARELAEGLGVSLLRPEMPNDSPKFIAALASIVQERLQP